MPERKSCTKSERWKEWEYELEFMRSLISSYVRPDVKGLIVNGKETNYGLFPWPFRTVGTKDELIVFKVLWQWIKPYQLILSLIFAFMDESGNQCGALKSHCL